MWGEKKFCNDNNLSILSVSVVLHHVVAESDAQVVYQLEELAGEVTWWWWRWLLMWFLCDRFGLFFLFFFPPLDCGTNLFSSHHTGEQECRNWNMLIFHFQPSWNTLSGRDGVCTQHASISPIPFTFWILKIWNVFRAEFVRFQIRELVSAPSGFCLYVSPYNWFKLDPVHRRTEKMKNHMVIEPFCGFMLNMLL